MIPKDIWTIVLFILLFLLLFDRSITNTKRYNQLLDLHAKQSILIKENRKDLVALGYQLKFMRTALRIKKEKGK